MVKILTQFQSTPSVKRATSSVVILLLSVFYFNPHPLWRGRRDLPLPGNPKIPISIHTLCEEGDPMAGIHSSYRPTNFNPHPLWRGRLVQKLLNCTSGQFQSTPSVKRATYNFNSNKERYIISIHTLCEEGDAWLVTKKLEENPISIHTLCEEGDSTLRVSTLTKHGFQSTPSVKRATFGVTLRAWQTYISIHTLCEEGDC